jgi:hypothetical protein
MGKRPDHSDNGDRFWSNKQGFLHRIHGPSMEGRPGPQRRRRGRHRGPNPGDQISMGDQEHDVKQLTRTGNIVFLTGRKELQATRNPRPRRKSR